jgi:Cytochrome c554 and c-prime
LNPSGKLLLLFGRSPIRCSLLLAATSLLAAPCAISQEQLPDAAGPAVLHEPPPASAFAGDAACADCHEKEDRAFLSSPHHLDSAIATPKTVLGSFTPGRNIVRTKDPKLIFAMIAADDGFFQSGINIADPGNLKGIAERFDIVIGSGRRGQTYLYWKGDQLFELPIAYWTYTHEWINSPGYPDGQVHFNRPVIPRCLECHSTWFETLQIPNIYRRENMILSIGCEKCHGPGQEHVERERSANPPAKGSPEEAIVNPARLSRQRQIDVCALCHAGLGDSLQPQLSYRPGDVLADYLKITPPPPNIPVDVHGNQVSALERSKCYSSGRMTCSTCHNVHEKQQNVDSFSVHCLECHDVRACGRFRQMGETIRTKCVECHMPEGQSKGLTSETEGHMLQAELRVHRIAIYPEAGLIKPAAPSGTR